jgi:hypothetical protein
LRVGKQQRIVLSTRWPLSRRTTYPGLPGAA